MSHVGVFAKIYEIVAAIPKGRVMTYGEVAAMVGNPRLARRVGQALYSRRAEGLPCHRVVKKNGVLPPEELFDGRQRQMLEEEGVRFLPDGRIDMKQWA